MNLRNWLSAAFGTPPSAPASPSTGYPTDGNPSTGTPATVPGAYWFYQLSEELRNAILGGGFAAGDLSGTTLTQLRDAVLNLCGGHSRTVTAGTTTLTVADAGLVLVDASAGNVTVNLPSAAALATLSYQFVRLDTSTNIVVINRAGTDVIGGAITATAVALTPQSPRLWLTANGVSRWVDSSVSYSDLPLAALQYPTIATADNRLAVTPTAVAGTGGTVSVPAGVPIALAEEVVPGVSGRMRAWTTAAWVSGNLDANATYYLRAQISGGALVVYTTKGADADAIPGGLRGTPNAASGGGFDSTQIDLLIAKIVTGANGTVPTVTALANTWRLFAGVSTGYGPTGSQVTVTTSLPLNWGRTPGAANVIVDCCDLTGHFEQAAIGRIYTYSRYTTSMTATYVPNGVTQLSWVTRGIINL